MKVMSTKEQGNLKDHSVAEPNTALQKLLKSDKAVATNDEAVMISEPLATGKKASATDQEVMKTSDEAKGTYNKATAYTVDAMEIDYEDPFRSQDDGILYKSFKLFFNH